MQKKRYEIIETLGCGATSRVDKARDSIIGRTVAIKTLVHSFGAAPEQKQFLREAQIIGKLSHPCIVNLYDVDIEESGMGYLVMEYVTGKTLQHLISDGPIPVPRACAWAADLASALGCAHHAGIIHGDVKPANILVTDDGSVKLGDFGIARFATQVSGSGRLMGTPAYLSPEQILGQPQNTRSDLFSLGVVLYQMVTGTRPFDGTSVSAVCAQILSSQPVPPSKHNPALPPLIDHVVMRCLAKDPADRYPTGEALAASLYPLARRAPMPLPRRKGSWITGPIRPLDAWIFAAFAAVAVLGVTVTRSVSARLKVPDAPARVMMTPAAPKDLLGHSNTQVPIDAESEGQAATVVKARAPRVILTAARNQPSHPNAPVKTEVPTVPLSGTLALSAAPSAPAQPAVQHTALNVDIDTSVSEGTLAVFADHELLMRADLHGGTPEMPIHLEHLLPVGPHQLRVALYRADKSLQTEKEGLAEISMGAANILKVRVSRKAKLLVKHETSLEVIWPVAGTVSTQGGASVPYSASVK
ncbi:MAG TPA: serine/threonine-protein kinase [Candidatus Acidoferrum sp.]|jgi:serine/threonine protein kinase